LASTFCLLALYPEEQQVIYDEVTRLASKYGRDELPFGCYDELPKTRGAFAEALRMYPPAPFSFKECTEDTVVKVPVVEADGCVTEESVRFAKGSTLVYDFIGMRA
jgi:cytochrome P450